MSFKGASFLLGLKPPRHPCGLSQTGQWAGSAEAGGAGRPCCGGGGAGARPAGASLTLLHSEQREVSLGFAQLCRGHRVTYHVDKLARGSWWQAAPQQGLRPQISTSSGAQGSVPNVHSTEQCSHIRIRVHGTNAWTYSRISCGTIWSEIPGISHQKLSVEPVNILCGRFLLSKLP